MANFDKNRFCSTNQEWETPSDLFQKINRIYKFTRDVCASEKNKKCVLFWSESDSCLNKKWQGINWMNPPFKDMKKFIKKAYLERFNAVTVCLIPARTNTRWWHDWCMEGEISFICGRPKFGNAIHGLPQPLALVIFGKRNKVMNSFFLD
jgi:phage N-6-adenine-methyltransferase